MSDVLIKKKRPVHLDVTKIRMPIPAFVSILHRISGAGLFLMLPLLLWLFSGSLGTPEQAARVAVVAGIWPVKLLLLGLVWAFMHHFCSGIRFLLLDVHKGLELHAARRSARIVLVVSLVLTLIIGSLTW